MNQNILDLKKQASDLDEQILNLSREKYQVSEVNLKKAIAEEHALLKKLLLEHMVSDVVPMAKFWGLTYESYHDADYWKHILDIWVVDGLGCTYQVSVDTGDVVFYAFAQSRESYLGWVSFQKDLLEHIEQWKEGNPGICEHYLGEECVNDYASCFN